MMDKETFNRLLLVCLIILIASAFTIKNKHNSIEEKNQFNEVVLIQPTNTPTKYYDVNGELILFSHTSYPLSYDNRRGRYLYLNNWTITKVFRLDTCLEKSCYPVKGQDNKYCQYEKTMCEVILNQSYLSNGGDDREGNPIIMNENDDTIYVQWKGQTDYSEFNG